MDINLNKLKIHDADGPDQELTDFSVTQGETTVIFRDLETKLIEQIEKYPIILGCVAWLTNFRIIEAMQNKDISIIVQKEDFLRPESHSKNWHIKLHEKYFYLKNNLTRYELPGIANQLSVGRDPSIAPIRCLGNHNSQKKLTHPRMHNKFLVFCHSENKNLNDYGHIEIIPNAVWSGSFNFSENANNSFENAILIENKEISMAYAKEYSQIFALSEPLDWETPWMEPEYRIGT
ncbi:MAG: hypothetical protein ACHQYQ_03505 [Bacteriovoracales bacterium]